MNAKDLLAFSPTVEPSSILKPDADNLMVIQTPVHKNLKVSFQTPARTPFGTIVGNGKKQENLRSVIPRVATQNWHVLKDLDEDLRWKERIEVVTKSDHHEYTRCAHDFIEQIIDVVAGGKSSRTSKLLVESDKDKENNLSEPVKETPKPKKTSKKRLLARPKSYSTSDVDNCVENFDMQNIDPFKSTRCLGNSPKTKSNENHPVAENTNTKACKVKSPVDDGLPCVSMNAGNPFENSKLDNSSLMDIFTSMSFADNSVLGKENNLALQSALDLNTSDFNDSVRPFPGDITSSTENQDMDNTLVEEAEPETVVSDANVESQFQSAEALVQQGFTFDLDYLANKGNDVIGTSLCHSKTAMLTSNVIGPASNKNYDIANLRKQSLFLKFDPLVAGAEDALSRTLIGRKSDIIDLNGPNGLPRHRSRLPEYPIIDEEPQPDLICDSPSKFLKAMERRGTTSVRRATTEEHKEKEEEKKEQEEAESCDSASVTLSDADSSEEIIEVLRYSESDMRRMLDGCRDPLNKKVAELSANNGELWQLLHEFEITTQRQEDEQQKNEVFIAKLEKEVEQLQGEKEELNTHLGSVEKAYMELLKRAEQMKALLSKYKENEKSYKKAIDDSQKRYRALKITMEEKTTKLTTNYEQELKDKTSKLSSAEVRCKFLENQVKSLKAEVERKSQENQELTTICDELLEQHSQKT